MQLASDSLVTGGSSTAHGQATSTYSGWCWHCWVLGSVAFSKQPKFGGQERRGSIACSLKRSSLIRTGHIHNCPHPCPSLGEVFMTWASNNTVALSPSTLIQGQIRERPLPLGRGDVVIAFRTLVGLLIYFNSTRPFLK